MNGRTPDQCIATFLQEYKTFGETYVPTAGRLARLRPDNLSRVLDVYFSLNGLNVVDFDVVETEKQLKVELFRDEQVIIYFTDKSDGIVKMHADAGGGLASMEHKTGEYIDDDWFEKYTMDGQVTGHVWASRESGYSVDGVVINAIQFNLLPDINDPKNVKKKGGYRSCTSHHLPLDQCHLQHVKFARRLFTRSDADIAMWKQQAIATALDYYHWLVEGKLRLEGVHLVPQQGLMRGACKYCDFKQFCGSHRLNYNLLIKRPPRDNSVMSSGLYEKID
jgi:hypothetical protein